MIILIELNLNFSNILSKLNYLLFYYNIKQTFLYFQINKSEFL